jgi:hypothetical protein
MPERVGNRFPMSDDTNPEWDHRQGEDLNA